MSNDGDEDPPATDDPNPDGEGGDGDGNPSGLVKLIEDLFKAAYWLGKEIVTGLVEAAEALQGRSVVGQISNSTAFTLTLTDQHHDHGGWDQPPPATIGPRQAGAFTSHTTGLATGTQGYVTYSCDEVSITCNWDNPEVGSNSSSMELSGPQSASYEAIWQNGHGNTGAQMNYALVVHPPYSARKTLQAHTHAAEDISVLSWCQKARTKSLKVLLSSQLS